MKKGTLPQIIPKLQDQIKMMNNFMKKFENLGELDNFLQICAQVTKTKFKNLNKIKIILNENIKYVVIAIYIFQYERLISIFFQL